MEGGWKRKRESGNLVGKTLSVPRSAFDFSLSELKVPRVGLSLSFRKWRTNQFPVGFKRSERHWYLTSVLQYSAHVFWVFLLRLLRIFSISLNHEF